MTSKAQQRLTVSCLCGAAEQSVSMPLGAEDDLALCHCDECRHVTGLLCASYLPLCGPPPSIVGLVGYSPSTLSTRYFCDMCGCHVFRATRGAEDDDDDNDKNANWEVATGVIVESPDKDNDGDIRSGPSWPSRHLHIDETRDGGISIWLPTAQDKTTPPPPPPPPSSAKPPISHPKSPATSHDHHDSPLLPASCHCGTVSFHLTRPGQSSLLPHSPFPDLMIPYRSGSSLLPNPSDTKWWIRGDDDDDEVDAGDNSSIGTIETRAKTKYLAGTCACRSCRLISGFEIQTWAFVPRSNIFIRVAVPVDATNTDTDADSEPPTINTKETTSPVFLPLIDISALAPNLPLKNYESSPDVFRSFCPRCGATVFWSATWRADLIDVSVGLLRAEAEGSDGNGGGARAESWLDWWTGRVSFAEDAGLGRTGWAAARAGSMIDGLERNLHDWGPRDRREGGLRVDAPLRVSE